MTAREDQRLELVMGRTLQIGVMLAALVVLAGGTLYMVQCHGLIARYNEFHGAPARYRSFIGIVASVRRLDSRNLIQFGILLLIGTPIFRVIAGVVGFSIQRDRFYAAVSLIVLAILLTSLFTGR
jgi:uncharacterized membrane protein